MTKDGEINIALVEARRLDHSDRTARERAQLLLIEDARRGLDDIRAGRTQDADEVIAAMQRRRRNRSAT